MAKILIPTSGVADWKILLADPKRHWKAGNSAMATARSWQSADGLPIEIKNILGADAELLLAIPEHRVSLPGGNRESQCDVFALVRCGDSTVSVAIEAKVLEPFGPTVGDWLRDASAGKTERLMFICGKLGVSFPPPGGLRYQLLHRTAAAIVEAERFKTDAAAMIVQSFSPEHRWFDEFALFSSSLGVNASVNQRHEIVLPDGRDLILGWATGSSEFLSEIPDPV